MNDVFSITTILKITVSTVVALVSVMWIYRKVLRIAQTRNLMDNPETRKLQEKPIPVLGGVAVFFGLLAGLMTAAVLLDDFYGLLPVMLAATILLYIGTIDDILDLSPALRFVIECVVMLGLIYSSDKCVDSLHGMWGIDTFSPWVGVPLTVFAGVGIINAFNMVDGVNGLSSSLCILVSTLLGTIFYKSGDPVNAALAYCFAAALVPFFMHNVFGNKSRMFIGDGGTMVMGVLVSWFVIQIMSHDGLAAVKMETETHLNMAAALLAVASVPVFDTLRVMTMRVLHGTSPFRPDKTHLHHAFIALGISHSITTLCELLLDVLVVGAWYLCYKLGGGLDAQMGVTIVAAVLLVMGAYALLHYTAVHDSKTRDKMEQFSVRTHLGSTRWWQTLTKWLDRDC